MHSLYRELLALRHDLAVLRRGSIEFADADESSDVIRFERRLADERIVVLVNVSDSAVEWPTGLVDATVLLSTDRNRRTSGDELAPDEAVVLKP